jgi:hypothetical protein
MISPKLDLVHKAIRAGILGHIQWKDASERLIRDDPQLNAIGPRGIRALVRKFVLDGNLLDARPEKRQEFLKENPDHPYWYRAIIPVDGFPHGLFVELVLIDHDPDEPWVEIVSAHRQEP